MNRREFIAAAAIGLGASATHAKTSIKVGVLGATHSHAAEKLRILRSHPSFDFVGAVEESERVRSSLRQVRWISREELFAQAEIVVIESDVRDHAGHAMQALRAGKHVHVEKPPTANWNEMLELVKIAREKQRLVQVGYMWRHNPAFTRIFEAVREGWIGEVVQVKASMNNRLADSLRADWAQFAGGAFFEQAAHLVDVIIRLMGRPKAVTSILRSSKGDELVDNNVAVFEFDRALAMVTNSTSQPNAFAHRQFEVLGTNGTMIVKPLEPPALIVDLAKAAGPYPAGLHSVELPKYERYRDEFDELARCVSNHSDLPVSLGQELLVQEWLLRSSHMFS